MKIEINSNIVETALKFKADNIFMNVSHNGEVSVVSIDNAYCIKFSKGINEIEKDFTFDFTLLAKELKIDKIEKLIFNFEKEKIGGNLKLVSTEYGKKTNKNSHFSENKIGEITSIYGITYTSLEKTIPITENLKKHFELISQYVSKDDRYYNLMGIGVDTENNTIIATDGRRLQYCNFDWSPLNLEKDIYKINSKIVSFLENISCDKIGITENYTYLKSETVGNECEIFISNIAGAKYPNWKKVLPENNPNSILVHDLKRIVLENKKEFKSSDCKYCTVGKEIKVYSKNYEYYCGDLPYFNFERLTFNGRYLLEVCSQISKNAVMTFSRKEKAVEFIDGEYHILLMPMYDMGDD